MIQPTIGRIVWFYPLGESPDSSQPLAAIITYVWSDTMVNLCVFAPIGETVTRYTGTSLTGSDPRKRSGRVQGMFRKDFWQQHVTTVGAIVATLAVIYMVFFGYLPASRAVGVLVFAWMLALHAIGNRMNAEKHERAVLMGLAVCRQHPAWYPSRHAGCERR